MARAPKMGDEDQPNHARRERVLQAAAGVFSDKGYRASTITDIGRELGFTSAALYYYFGSKQEILSELIVRPIQQLQAMATEVAATDLSNQAKVAEIVRRHIEMMLQQRELFTIFLRERVELEPVHARRLASLEEKYYQQIRNIIDDAARAGELTDVNPQLAALGLIGMTNWVLRWFRPNGALGMGEIAEGLMDIFQGGVFLARPGASKNGSALNETKRVRRRSTASKPTLSRSKRA